MRAEVHVLRTAGAVCACPRMIRPGMQPPLLLGVLGGRRLILRHFIVAPLATTRVTYKSTIDDGSSGTCAGRDVQLRRPPLGASFLREYNRGP